MICCIYNRRLILFGSRANRSKCHQYWPDVNSTCEYGSLSVTCTQQDFKSGFACREFTLTNKDVSIVSQILYLFFILA